MFTFSRNQFVVYIHAYTISKNNGRASDACRQRCNYFLPATKSKRSRLRSPSDGFCVLPDYRGTRLFNNLSARSRSKGKLGCRDIGRARVSTPAPRPSRKPREYSRFYVRKRETPSLLSSRTLTQGQGDSKTRR